MYADFGPEILNRSRQIVIKSPISPLHPPVVPSSVIRPARPKRSILFDAVGAEEQGLLGSQYFAQHPTIPAGQIALAINFDAVPQLGSVRDVTMLGVERTTFLPAAARIAYIQRKQRFQSL